MSIKYQETKFTEAIMPNHFPEKRNSSKNNMIIYAFASYKGENNKRISPLQPRKGHRTIAINH